MTGPEKRACEEAYIERLVAKLGWRPSGDALLAVRHAFRAGIDAVERPAFLAGAESVRARFRGLMCVPAAEREEPE